MSDPTIPRPPTFVPIDYSPERIKREIAEATAKANANGFGFKADAGKLDFTLLPWGPLEDVVRVLMKGAEKYARDNWQKVPQAPERYRRAAFRHLVADAKGEKLDHETGLPHLAHATCCLLFAAWFDKG